MTHKRQSEHIYRRADDKAWVVAFRQAESRDEKRVYRSFNDDKHGGKAAALDAARVFHANAMGRQARGMTEPARVKATFADAAEKWYTHGLSKGWRASTASDYRGCLDSRLLPEFGHLLLARLTEQRVELWLETLRKEVSDRTVRKLLFVGGAVCERAHRDYPGYTANPFREIEKGSRPEMGDLKDLVYTREEVAAIIRAAATDQDAAMFLLAWRTGIRRGELAALLVGDVDFVGRNLHVHYNFVHGCITSPKGKKSRHVPLNESVRRALDALLRERGDPAENELLFPAENTRSAFKGEVEIKVPTFPPDACRHLMEPDAISRRFTKALKTSKVNKLHLHCLRHTYISELAAKGVNPWDILDFAGHKSIDTTMHYVHTFGPKQEHADTVDAVFGDTPVPEPAEERDQREFIERVVAETVARLRSED
jgi:integrase